MTYPVALLGNIGAVTHKVTTIRQYLEKQLTPLRYTPMGRQVHVRSRRLLFGAKIVHGNNYRSAQINPPGKKALYDVGQRVNWAREYLAVFVMSN